MSAGAAPTAPLPTVAGRGAVARALHRLTGALLLTSVALLAVVAVGAALGLRVRIEQTGSMAPALQPGDLVIVEQVSAARVAIGDVIGVRAADGRVIVHRVRAIEPDRSALAITTRGDANPTGERWSIAPTDDVARVRGRVPALGHAVDALRGPAGAGLVLLAGVLLAGSRLRGIWSRA